MTELLDARAGTGQVYAEVTGAVARLVLNRPESLNTMTASFLDDFLQTLEQVAENPNVRVVIIIGAGRAFCAGGDLKAGVGGGVGGEPPLASQARRLRTYMRSVQLIRSMQAVTIAAVRGACAGAGLSIACAADLRLAQTDARFNTAFLSAGLSGDFGGTWLLPRIVGGGRARELYLNPVPFGADKALAIGLVSEVVEDVSLRANEYAAEMLLRPPLALTRIKQNLNDAEELPLASLLDMEAERHSWCATTEDAAEATAAFIQRRPAVFTGA